MNLTRPARIPLGAAMLVALLARLAHAAFPFNVHFAEDFNYPPGTDLPAAAVWDGTATNGQIAIDSAGAWLKFTGGSGTPDAYHVMNYAGSNNVIHVHLLAMPGNGTQTMWSIWFDDPAGNNLARWYGSGTSCRGRIGGTNVVTEPRSLNSGEWNDLDLRINTAARTSDFYLNGSLIGSLVHSAAAANTLGRIRFARVDNSLAAGQAIYFDELRVGQEPEAVATPLPWTSPKRYRVVLTVEPKGQNRSHCPISIDMDLAGLLMSHGAGSPLDETTIDVFAYGQDGRPVVYDASTAGCEQYLVPWRIDRYYGTTKVTFNSVIPDQTCTRLGVYFDTQGEQVPSFSLQRYPGIVGDGDFFREQFKRREINASHFDAFCDFDGDGDLDLFKGGVEPYVYVYENVGGNRMVDRGRLTSGGNLLTLPNSNGRSWLTVAFYDWDGDGDQDFFPSFTDGPDAGRIVHYENTTSENAGVLTFTRVGPLETVTGAGVAGGAQAGGWFPSITFVPDWDGDGDGLVDVLVGSNNRCYLYRNLGPGTDGPLLADAVAIQAAGSDIILSNPRFDVADIDADGDLDLFAGTQPGTVWWFRNTGTRTAPAFAAPVAVAYQTPYLIGDAHSGVKVADFDDDGLLDLVAGRFWERTPISEVDQPRYYGGLHKNIGTATAPAFQRRGAEHGSPYTEGFPICDAVRQNSVRMVDWNSDGRPDLLAGDTDGFVWYFRNAGTRLHPLFAAGERLRAGGQWLSRYNSGGHARLDVTDWNNDGMKDLVVADGSGAVTMYLNTGTDAIPVLAAGQRLSAGGSSIMLGSRSSVLVCDYDRDGRKDLVGAGEVTGYQFFRNTGSDSAPVLAAGKTITFNGQPVNYVRPNLGSFLDWDGDGKGDLIACAFENNVRFYQNIDSGAEGQEPQYASVEGQLIVSPFTVQMISGADASDWRGDGDADILTGQGHGGSGLRFYERDYITNFVNQTAGVSTWPIVTVGILETHATSPDLDGDGDVDQTDFGILQRCLSGADFDCPWDCIAADLDGDGSVNGSDLLILLQCMNGPNQPPGC